MAETTLNDQLRADLTAAMKARDAVATSTLRLVRTAISNAEVAGETAITLDDAGVIAVLESEAKKRAEAAEVYAEAGRTEQAAAERAELAVIERYLPEKMSDDEVGTIVDEEIANATADGTEASPKLMGQVIGAVRKRTGSAADGALIASLVKQRLAG